MWILKTNYTYQKTCIYSPEDLKRMNLKRLHNYQSPIPIVNKDAPHLHPWVDNYLGPFNSVMCVKIYRCKQRINYIKTNCEDSERLNEMKTCLLWLEKQSKKYPELFL